MMMEHLALVDGQFGERQATGAFVLSRMRVQREAETKGRARLLQLCFEDWLESLVRMALQKALPAEEEWRAAGCVDAGHYMLMLQSDPAQKHAWEDLLRRRSASHTMEEEEEAMSAHVAVEALITLILRSVQLVLGRPVETPIVELTLTDIKAFAQSGGAARLRPAAGVDSSSSPQRPSP